MCNSPFTKDGAWAEGTDDTHTHMCWLRLDVQGDGRVAPRPPRSCTHAHKDGVIITLHESSIVGSAREVSSRQAIRLFLSSTWLCLARLVASCLVRSPVPKVERSARRLGSRPRLGLSPFEMLSSRLLVDKPGPLSLSPPLRSGASRTALPVQPRALGGASGTEVLTSV